MKKDDWKESGDITLEDAAKSAVICENNTLVIAGPGSGKTELLTQKAGYLFETNISKMPRKILAISFKKDAADNLKNRIVTRYGERYKDRFISMTYDAFFKSILDRFYRSLPSEYAINISYKIADSDKLTRAFVLAGYACLNDMKSRDANQRVSVFINNSILPLNDTKLKNAWDIMLRGNESFKPALSFEMIAKLALLIIKDNPSIRTIIRATFSHVFLDEFQDTTNIQYKIVKMLFMNSGVKLTAVGDNKQRIMLWAGARKTVFDDYLKDFKSNKYKLLMNHRSAPRLIELQKSMYKSLQENTTYIIASTKWNDKDGIINLVISENNEAEAEQLANMIQSDINRGIKQNNIALLCKQKPENYSGDVIDALSNIGVRARIETEYQDLLKDDIINIILSVIILANSRQNPQEWGYIQTISDQAFGNTNVSAAMYVKMLGDLEELFINIKNEFSQIDSIEDLYALQDKIIDFFGKDRIKAMFPENKQGDYLDKKLLKFSELFWKELIIAKKDWHNAVKGFRGEESIPIMTIHKSKGLEYDSVYFVGLEDSAFWNFKNQPEEDRCAFFVALSRAKQIITFTYCKHRYNLKYEEQCRETINEFYELLQKPGVAEIIYVN